MTLDGVRRDTRRAARALPCGGRDVHVVVSRRREKGLHMKKLTDSEKLDKLRDMFSHVSEVTGVADCPYGDPSHHRDSIGPLAAEKYCRSCSKLDGSECVDEFIACVEAVLGEYPQRSDDAMRDTFQAMREWRKARTG